VTYLPNQQLLRWAYAGHPPALRMPDGGELVSPRQGIPLGLRTDHEYFEGTLRPDGPAGVLLYTDGLTEARRNGTFFGVEGVTAVLGELQNPSAREAVATLRARVEEFADSHSPADDMCMLAASIQ
jgi:phosphoserine phosphatase RsbU/P